MNCTSLSWIVANAGSKLEIGSLKCLVIVPSFQFERVEEAASLPLKIDEIPQFPPEGTANKK